MKYKFEFNHKVDSFSQSIPSTVNPAEATAKLFSMMRNEEAKSKSELIEMILKAIDPQTPNDILMLGIAFGTTHAMERFADPDAGLPPPAITENILMHLMKYAYGKDRGGMGTWSIDEDKVEEHIKQEKHDF